MAGGVAIGELGLTRGKVKLSASDPSWPEVFGRLALEIRDALGALAMGVEHVGSTAIPGLRAKPIIDIAVGLSAEAAAEDLVAALLPLGYEFRGDQGEAGGGLLFVLEDAPAHR